MSAGGQQDFNSHHLKIIVIGDERVGKSTMFDRIMGNKLRHRYKPTERIISFTLTQNVNGKSFKMDCHDIPGSLWCTDIIDDYYRYANVTVIVYDVTSRSSFENVEGWVREVKDHANLDRIGMIIGNKIDLTDSRQVSFEEGKSFAEKSDFCFMETFATDSDQMETVIGFLIAYFLSVKFLRSYGVPLKEESDDGSIPVSGLSVIDSWKFQIGPINDDSNNSEMLKMIIIGDEHVGKSNLCARFIWNKFRLEYESNNNIHSASATLDVNGKEVKWEIHDIAGSLKSSDKIKKIYKRANVVLLVYDVTQRSSFENAKGWLREFRDHSGLYIPIILVGNKIDLTNRKEISTEEGKSFAQKWSLQYFVETSALNSTNVEDAFNHFPYKTLLYLPRFLEKFSDQFFDNAALVVPPEGPSSTDKRSSSTQTTNKAQISSSTINHSNSQSFPVTTNERFLTGIGIIGDGSTVNVDSATTTVHQTVIMCVESSKMLSRIIKALKKTTKM